MQYHATRPPYLPQQEQDRRAPESMACLGEPLRLGGGGCSVEEREVYPGARLRLRAQTSTSHHAIVSSRTNHCTTQVGHIRYMLLRT